MADAECAQTDLQAHPDPAEFPVDLVSKASPDRPAVPALPVDPADQAVPAARATWANKERPDHLALLVAMEVRAAREPVESPAHAESAESKDHPVSQAEEDNADHPARSDRTAHPDLPEATVNQVAPDPEDPLDHQEKTHSTVLAHEDKRAEHRSRRRFEEQHHNRSWELGVALFCCYVLLWASCEQCQ